MAVALASCESAPPAAPAGAHPVLTAKAARLPSGLEERKWDTIVSDGLHDPASPAAKLLQNPGEALSPLPPDPYNDGNKVNWVLSLRQGFIEPRTNIFKETKVNILDQDILMKDTGEMPLVLFPHDRHTAWLDCSNCHDRIFKPKTGANPVNMYKILQGDYCGQCHGAVAFPLTECYRCHSVQREHSSLPQILPPQEESQ